MNVIKVKRISKSELENLGYTIAVFSNGYHVRYGTLLIESWKNPGNISLDSNNTSGMEEFYESLAWEKVKKHFRENSDIATLKPGDEFMFWSNKVFRVESIEGDVLHCVTIKPVAPNGADVTKRFRISELTVAVDVEISEEEVTS